MYLLSRRLSGASPGSVSGLDIIAATQIREKRSRIRNDARKFSRVSETIRRSLSTFAIITARNFRRDRLGSTENPFILLVSTRRNMQNSEVYPIYPLELVETGLSGRVFGRAFKFGSIVRKNRSFCTVHEQFTILPAVKSRIRTWNDSRTQGGRDDAQRFTASL